jgi:hypothetical protein
MPSPWYNRGKKRFEIVGVKQTLSETGLTLTQLLDRTDVEPIERTFADGSREKALRLPRELLVSSLSIDVIS